MDADDNSLLARHQRILAGAPRTPADAEEQAASRALPLPPLALPPRQASALPRQLRRWIPPLALAAAAAASLLVLVRPAAPHGGAPGPLTSKDSPLVADDGPGPLTGKGGSLVAVYWDGGGESHRLKPGDVLHAGDRFRVQVTAGEALTGYAAVLDASGALLLDAPSVLSGALPLAAGQTAAFAGSFRLEGDGHEAAAVLLCRAPLADAAALIKALSAPPPGCESRRYVLR